MSIWRNDSNENQVEASSNEQHNRLQEMQEPRLERIRAVRGMGPVARQQSGSSGFADQAPSCVQACLVSYAGDQFDSDCVSNGLSCLCSKYSSQGFTLGELALSCAYVNCSNTGRQDEIDAYNICNSIRNSVIATHTVLTVAPPRTTSTASTSIMASSATATTTSSASLKTPSATADVSSTGSSASSTAAIPLDQAHALSATQVAGAAIGSIGAVALVGAVIVYLLYRRRSKARSSSPSRGEKYGFDFIDRTPAQSSPHDFVCYQPSQHQPMSAGLDYSNASASPSTAIPRNKVNIPPAIAGIGIGGAMSSQRPETSQQRNSQESTRTVSQLLPDLPQPIPSTVTQSSRRPQAPMEQQPYHELPASSPIRTPATVFEEDGTPYVPLTADMPSMPPRSSSLHPRFAERRTPAMTAVEQRQPALSLDIPRQSTRPVPQSRNGIQATRGYARSQHYSNPRWQISVANTSHGPRQQNMDSPIDPELTSPTSATPIDEDEQRRRAVPAAIIVSKPSRSPRAVHIGEKSRSKGLNRHDSTGSCTSFEDGDEDEGLRGDSDKQLSPVQEHSPISGIRYPKIPQSAYMHTSGSPNSRVRHDVPLPLRIGQSDRSQQQPTQVRYARDDRYQEQAWTRNMSNTPRMQEVEVKSPLWEPKLTPSRRGDDLYLSVSLASPR